MDEVLRVCIHTCFNDDERGVDKAGASSTFSIAIYDRTVYVLYKYRYERTIAFYFTFLVFPTSSSHTLQLQFEFRNFTTAVSI